MMSGAGQGQGARASAYGTAAGANSNANDNRLSSIAGIGNNLTNLAGMFGGAYGTGGNSQVSSAGGFNKTAPTVTKTYTK